MTDAYPRQSVIAANLLGGPGAPDPRECSGHAMIALGEAAGPEMRLTSLSLEVASHLLGDGEVALTIKVDKRARSIAFASVEARSGDKLVYSAQGLFSRAG
jgi:hypothetical protein